MNTHTAIICLTHRCNLDCVYCFETKDAHHELSMNMAFHCVDDIIKHYCINKDDAVNLNFFGGEPLLKFDLIKLIYNYVQDKYPDKMISFFASTNGTLLTSEMKSWFSERKDKFCLGLSLDGDKDSQNYNRSNSFNCIDIKYFAENWPQQSFKVTISEYSIRNYAHDVKFIHSFGVGVNGGVCVGKYKWDNENLYYVFAKQLMILIDYYEQHPTSLNNLFDIDLAACTMTTMDRKCCGCGTTLSYYETNGMKYPCTFIAPMAFPAEDLKTMLKTDYSNNKNFTDNSCKADCYLFNICMTCAAENFLINHSFHSYNKRNCGLKKIIALAVAELQARKIAQNPNIYNKTKLYYTIEAIQKIKELYLPKYGKYFMEKAENP